MADFENELRGLINRNSKENKSNTPDYILAAYLLGCLECFDLAVNERTRWYAPEQPQNSSEG